MQRSTDFTTGSHLYGTAPLEGLGHAARRCKYAIHLLERVDLPAKVRTRQLSAWKYVASFIRFIDRCYTYPDMNRDPSELRHMYYVMLPNLLEEHIPATAEVLRQRVTSASAEQAWRSVWVSFTDDNLSSSRAMN